MGTFYAKLHALQQSCMDFWLWIIILIYNGFPANAHMKTFLYSAQHPTRKILIIKYMYFTFCGFTFF